MDALTSLCLIHTAQQVVKDFQALRDGITNDQWDKLCECELMDALLTSLMDLETEVEEEG